MQDRYVGDIGDFGKFCLLSKVIDESPETIKLGINWYYVSLQEKNTTDGNYINYLDEKNKASGNYKSCSPGIYEKLKKIVEHKRLISEIESNNVLPKNTIFYHRPIPTSGSSSSKRIQERETWFKESFSKLQSSDIVFLDPDNGIQVNLAKKAQSISNKYAFIDEIEKYFLWGKSLIVYNHRDRRPIHEYNQKILSIMQFAYSSDSLRVLRFKRMSVRDYVFVIQDKHQELVKRAFSKLLSEPFNFLFEEFPLSEGGAMSTTKKYWTNPSVQKLAGDSDPIDFIANKARGVVLAAMEEGWNGPPFDPFELAKLLKISTVPNEDIFEARIVPIGSNRYQMEFNPNKPPPRIRFSLAHELSHTLFPDCRETIRNRELTSSIRSDNWQLELLCNIAAAEFLMPLGTGMELADEPVAIDNILRLKNEYQVSAEAILLRFVNLTRTPCTVFVAARNLDEHQSSFRIDYSVASRSSTLNIPKGFLISSKSILSECVAVGFTAKGIERWSSRFSKINIECAGIPPYPYQVFPRIMGIARTKMTNQPTGLQMKYLYGDALIPRGSGKRIIAHIVNDKTPNWGAGFGRVVKTKYPLVQNAFRAWVAQNTNNLNLGQIFSSTISDDMSIVQMVAQHGYGPSKKPRIRYAALQDCLDKLAAIASQLQVSVHMPKIGTGYAGGNWCVISQLIDETLIRNGIKVTVYELPNASKCKFIQGSLRFPSGN